MTQTNHNPVTQFVYSSRGEKVKKDAVRVKQYNDGEQQPERIFYMDF